MSEYFLNGTFTGEDGITYSVLKLAEWACSPATIDSGASRLVIVKTNALKFGVTDEKIGSPEFLKRVEAATLLDPLLVTKDLYIIDGVHRLHKARQQWITELLAYVIDESQIPTSARVLS